MLFNGLGSLDGWINGFDSCMAKIFAHKFRETFRVFYTISKISKQNNHFGLNGQIFQCFFFILSFHFQQNSTLLLYKVTKN